MQNGEPHPLLAQIPLTVSPFVHLPTVTTLPYTYKSLPSTLPPSSTGEGSDAGADNSPKPKYVVSSSGHAAHPDEIIESCRALQAHLLKMQDDAEAALRRWRTDVEARELAEKRRLAPGWLDRDEKILAPEKKGAGVRGVANGEVNIMDVQEEGGPTARSLAQQRLEEGEQLDRAFGGMALR